MYGSTTPPSVTTSARGSRASGACLYLTGNNLLTFTKYSGIDPEINQGGVAPGVDNNNFYPRTRTVMFGATVSF